MKPNLSATPRTLPAIVGAGRYELHGELGRGGAARVFRARDTQRNDWVAVKVLDPRAADHTSRSRRFATEAYMVSALVHPHLTAARDYQLSDDPNDVSYIVLDLVEGGTVEDRLSEHGPMAVAEAVRLMLDVMSGLSVVHQVGVVHRDIKPSNILIAEQGAQLTDFGIAHHDLVASDARRRLGTRGFAAPEQRFGDTDLGPETDIYALGATLYAMVTGRSPAEAETFGSEVTSLPEVDAGLGTVILRAMRFTPEQRYPSVQAMAVDLLEVYAALPDVTGGKRYAREWLRAVDEEQVRWSHRTLEDSLRPVQRLAGPSPVPTAPQSSSWPLLALAFLGAFLATVAIAASTVVLLGS